MGFEVETNFHHKPKEVSLIVKGHEPHTFRTDACSQRIKIMLSFLLAMLLTVNGQDCLVANNVNGLPPFQDYRGSNLDMGIIPHLHQAIVPSYRFHCCGNVTEWAADLNLAGGRDDMMYTLEFQVWRPAPGVSSTGCYSLIGSNRFTQVPLTDGVTLSLAPQLNDQISFQPGDVLGFYVESTADSLPENRGVVVLGDRNVQGDGEYQNEVVWFADFSNPVIGNSACPVIVGSTGTLSSSTNAAPVISLSLATTECPTKVTMTPISSTPTTNSLASTNSFTISSTLPNPSSLQPTTVTTDRNVDNKNVTSAGSLSLAIIIAPVVCVTMISFLTLLVVLAVCAKVRRKHKKSEASMTYNEAYGTGLQSLGKSADDTYDYPTMEQKPFDMKGNEAYATSIEIKTNEAYVSNTGTTVSATNVLHYT